MFSDDETHIHGTCSVIQRTGFQITSDNYDSIMYCYIFWLIFTVHKT